MLNISLAEKIHAMVKDKNEFRISDLKELIDDKPYTTIRARIYDNLGKLFKRVGRGVYVAITKDGTSVAMIHGDGRDLSMLEDNSIDSIITDHPYSDARSNIGGSRKFVDYECFNYTKHDWQEKLRVLKPGGFLIEFFAEENANNYQYIYRCKKEAVEAGFQYYCIVPWKKGNFVANTGRKSKNTEQIIIFSKGHPRHLRPDKQRGGLMSGTTAMLPTEFCFQPANVRQKIHKAEKPISLLSAIIQFVTLPGETILDQFAGSGNLGIACLNTKRFAILIEKEKQVYDKMVTNIRNHFENLVTT